MPELTPVKVGELQSVAKTNLIIERVNRLSTNVLAYQDPTGNYVRKPSRSDPANLIYTRLQAITHEWLLVKICDESGENIEEDEIKILRAPDFRVSAWSGKKIGGITYSFVDPCTRIATKQVEEVEHQETEKISRDYVTKDADYGGSIIRCVPMQNSVEWDGHKMSLVELHDGRDWTRVPCQ